MVAALRAREQSLRLLAAEHVIDAAIEHLPIRPLPRHVPAGEKCHHHQRWHRGCAGRVALRKSAIGILVVLEPKQRFVDAFSRFGRNGIGGGGACGGGSQLEKRCKQNRKYYGGGEQASMNGPKTLKDSRRRCARRG